MEKINQEEIMKNSENDSSEKNEEVPNENLTNESIEEKKISEEKVEEEPRKEKTKEKLDNKKGEGSFAPLFLIMFVSLIIAGAWEKAPWIKNSIHAALDPSAGALLNWELTIGMLILICIITLITTLIQKYATDQKTLKELKNEQKDIQKKMKELKHDPEKMMQLQKEMMPLSMKQMKLGMRGIIYTGIPFILLFRWFSDYFLNAGNPKFFGFMTWFWFYLIGAIVIGSILRKKMDVV